MLVIPSVTSRGGLGKEGFSLVALEAMGVGTPVVAYEYGGPPEVLGECGLLVPPGDRDALARRCCACSRTERCASSWPSAAAAARASGSRFQR